MGGWFLSRRDSTIVARHGSAWVSREAPRPGGTVEVKPGPGRFVVETEPMPFQICSIIPLGRAILSHDSRHFVPGYYRAIPTGQKPFAH